MTHDRIYQESAEHLRNPLLPLGEGWDERSKIGQPWPVSILTTPALPAYGEDELAALSHAALIDLLIRDEDRVPRNVIDHCASRGDAMIALLHAKIENEDPWLDETVLGASWLVLHAAMIAGLIASESAGLFHVRLLRRIDEADDDDLHDWLAGAWPWFSSTSLDP